MRSHQTSVLVLATLLSIGVLSQSFAGSSCPDIKSFKQIVLSKQPVDPFEPLVDAEGRKWRILKRLKPETKDNLEDLTIEAQEHTSTLAITSQARNCNYAIKDADGEVVDQAKLMPVNLESETELAINIMPK